MRSVLDSFRLINLRTLLVIALSLLATELCLKFGLEAELPASLLSLSIVFPVGFAISAAYRRREDALSSFASIKSFCLSLYFASRDWPQNPDAAKTCSQSMRQKLEKLLTTLAQELPKPNGGSLDAMLWCFSDVSKGLEEMRQGGVPANEIARANQSLREIMREFERMRNIAVYHTPTLLRAYARLFLHLLPLLFAPNFAYYATEYYAAIGYTAPVVYGFVLIGLDTVQETLENPFDQIGADDVRLNCLHEYTPIFGSN